jgi:hypothetical protein
MSVTLDPPYDGWSDDHEHFVSSSLNVSDDAYDAAMDYGPRLDVVKDRLGRIFIWDPFDGDGVVVEICSSFEEAVTRARELLG